MSAISHKSQRRSSPYFVTENDSSELHLSLNSLFSQLFAMGLTFITVEIRNLPRFLSSSQITRPYFIKGENNSLCTFISPSFVNIIPYFWFAAPHKSMRFDDVIFVIFYVGSVIVNIQAGDDHAKGL